MFARRCSRPDHHRVRPDCVACIPSYLARPHRQTPRRHRPDRRRLAATRRDAADPDDDELADDGLASSHALLAGDDDYARFAPLLGDAGDPYARVGGGGSRTSWRVRVRRYDDDAAARAPPRDDALDGDDAPAVASSSSPGGGESSGSVHSRRKRAVERAALAALAPLTARLPGAVDLAAPAHKLYVFEVRKRQTIHFIRAHHIYSRPPLHRDKNDARVMTRRLCDVSPQDCLPVTTKSK